MLYIYSPRPSNGARELAEAMNVRRLRTNGTRVLSATRDVCICWGGASPLPTRMANARCINPPAAVAEVSNKLTFFERMKDVRLSDRRITPLHFTNLDDASNYLRSKGGAIVCRTVLAGSAGVGIVIAETVGQLVDCQLYTRYIPKESEWRVHFVNKQIVDTQRKARRLDSEEANWRVRNLENGFVYTRDSQPPANVVAVAEVVIANTSLDFGAIDLVFNAQSRRAYCLEINSAPGLQGTTVQKYAEAFKEWLGV